MSTTPPEPPAPYYTADGVTLHLGDSLDVLPTLPDESVDAIVTDPPYGLADHHPRTVAAALAEWLDGDRSHVPDGQGFMGRDWDRFVPPPAVWDECWRVLKPGGHLVAFAGSRTVDLMTMSIRLAGFEIRDGLQWLYGSGFPKGVDVAKAIDRRRDDRADVLRVTAWLKAARDAAGWTSGRINELFGFHRAGMAQHWTTQGVAATVPTPEQWDRLREALGFDDAEIRPLVAALNGRKGTLGEAWAQREVIGQRTTGRGAGRGSVPVIGDSATNRDVTAPASDAARRWQGWNTALKPAHEPIVLARKSTGFDSTVANVVRHGTGALNIDACRTGTEAGAGRWPTNIVLSHPAVPDERGQPVGDACADGCVPGCPVAELDTQSGIRRSGANPTRRSSPKFGDAYGDFTGDTECTPARGADAGGASRFFPTFRYEAKAPAAERPRLPDGTTHPTVKPLALMRWLVRLITPPGGIVLDPFAGTGPTLEAALLEGFTALGIEREQPHAELCRIRLDKPLPIALFGDIA